MKQLILLALLLAVLVAASCGRVEQSAPITEAVTESSKQTGMKQSAEQSALLQCIYYDRELFLQGISAPQAYQCDGIPYAGTIPHHLLATDMIAGFLTLAAEHASAYDRIILIAPSHYPELCSSDVITAYAGWDTPYGRVAGDKMAVEALLNNRVIGAVNDPEAVERDHGAAGLIPYIRYYLPDIPVSVCLLSNHLSREQLEQVQQEIAAQCADGRTLLLASLDCSHYQTLEWAEYYDVQTREAIESRDIQAVLGFDDRNIDSPQVLSTFLTVAADLELQFLDRSSSGEKLPHAISNSIYHEGVTSYLVYTAYGRKDNVS